MEQRHSNYNPFRSTEGNKTDSQFDDANFRGDRSQDPFAWGPDSVEWEIKVSEESQTDPWTQPDLVETSFDSSLSPLDVSFDSAGSNEEGRLGGTRCSAERWSDFENVACSKSHKPTDSILHPNAFADALKPIKVPGKVDVMIQERLSILFDDLSDEPACRVLGLIFAKPVHKNHSQDPFCLTIRDPKSHVERWENQGGICENITAASTHIAALDQGDQFFRVNNRPNDNLEIKPILGYSCVPRLKPIPLLVKTKIQRHIDRCRVGIRIRANPSNQYVLTLITIILVVPPDMNGAEFEMSRKDGVWDDLKRTISWTIDKLDPGESIDLQATYENATGGPNQTTSKFPVLVRCDGDTTFSKIKVTGDIVDGKTCPVDVQVAHKARVIYRKVN